MKCELCNKADAACAITREREDGEEEELYVCRECAKSERQRRKAKSQRTRNVAGLPPGVSMSVTEISNSSEDGENGPPPILGAIMEAFSDMVDGIEKHVRGGEKPQKSAKKLAEFSLGRIAHDFRVGDRIHLEGLHLIGELEAVKRAMHALGMELVGVSADGVNDSGHAYRLMYGGSSATAKRVVEDILREEENARVRLRDEMQRVFGDSACRALAVLKNCRLLSSGELFDLLSPLRLAAIEGELEGISQREIDRMMTELDLSGSDEQLTQEARDRADAERADEMNRRFEEVMLDDIV